MKKIKFSVERKGREIHVDVFALSEDGLATEQKCGHLVMDQRHFECLILNSTIAVVWKWAAELQKGSNLLGNKLDKAVFDEHPKSGK